jgi:phosphate butyryltransferase
VNQTFDEIVVGPTSELRRLITADDLYVFAVVSGNDNPMHLTDTDVGGGRTAH